MSAAPNPLSKKVVVPSSAPPALWARLKPLARQMRHEPTPAEQMVWERLRSRQVAGAKFRRQHAIERFVVDFYCAEAGLVVEVDGPVHDYTPEEDAIRQEYLESLGLRVLRVTNADVFAEIGGVVAIIHAALIRGSASPPTRPPVARPLSTA